MRGEQLVNLFHESVLATPITGPNGNHSARLWRLIENVASYLDNPQDAQRPMIMLSRVGDLVRPLALDLDDNAISKTAAVELLYKLAAVGDCMFEHWLASEVEPAHLPFPLDEPDTSPSIGSSQLRHCLCEPIPAIFAAAARLVDGVVLHNRGDRVGAEKLFRLADDPQVRAFTERGWGKGAAARYGFLQLPDAPAYPPKALRPQPRMPTIATKSEVLARDGYHCRFCGIPVIAPEVRRRIQAAYPDAVGWGTTNVSQHAAFQCMWLQFDHLLPNSRGGDSSAANIVVACAVCNFGRMQATLEEAQLIHPLQHGPVPGWEGHDSWDGLQTFPIASFIQ